MTLPPEYVTPCIVHETPAGRTGSPEEHTMPAPKVTLDPLRLITLHEKPDPILANTGVNVTDWLHTRILPLCCAALSGVFVFISVTGYL
jgi:hypothetical protein